MGDRNNLISWLAGQLVSQFAGKPVNQLRKNRLTGSPAHWQTKRAFTLIELMLVVIIIGVLSAMVMPRLAGRSEQARMQAAKSDISSSLSLSLDLYEMDMGSFPDNLEALSAAPAGADNWHGPYLKKKAIDPWNRPYVYNYPGTHNQGSYDLSSLGKDGQAETPDDVKNWE